jgi:hypothetical protein
MRNFISHVAASVLLFSSGLFESGFKFAIEAVKSLN